MTAERKGERRHEQDTTSVGRIVLAAVVLALGIGAALGVSRWAQAVLEPEEPAEPEDARRPAAEFDHAAAWVRRGDAVELRRARLERLGSYGWVDVDEGVIHVPLERAVELVLAEGLSVGPLEEPQR